MAINLQGSSGSLLQGSMGAPAVPNVAQAAPALSTPSMGVAPKNPVNNIPVAAPKLTPAQAAPVNDLSKEYANVNGTIYNINGPTANTNSSGAYTNQASFFKDSGLNSFNNVKFDTSWTPPATPANNSSIPAGQAGSPWVSSTPATTLPQLFAQTQAANTTPTTTTPTTTTPYTPPNQGTTGVSQGGIIGNLIANANNNTAYTSAQNNVNNVLAQQQALAAQYGQDTTDINSRPEFLTEQNGQQGMLQQQYNTAYAGLANQYQGATNQLNAANTNQSNITSANSAAATANAPIAAGAYVSPSSNTTTGGTTSGAQTLNSLLTTTPNATGPGTATAYSAGGQTFATPAALSAWVNQQVGNGTATTPANVFQYLQQNGNQGVSGGGGTLNPLNNLAQTVQSVMNGSTPYATAVQQGASIPGFQNALNTAITNAGGNLTQIQAQVAGQQGAITSNTETGGTAAVNAGNALYQNLNPQYQNLANNVIPNIVNFGNLLTSAAGGVNPFSSTTANETWGQFQKSLSNTQWLQFQSTFQQLQKNIALMASTGGAQTPTANSEQAALTLDPNTSISSIEGVLNRISQEGSIYLNNLATASNAALNQAQGGSSTNTSSNNSTTIGLF